METEEEQLKLKQFLELLSVKNQELLRTFIKSLNGSISYAFGERIQLLLTDSPYPTLQILEILLKESKFHITNIISNALRQMIDDDASFPSTQLLSFIANVPQYILKTPTMLEDLQKYLLSVPWANNESSILALLARSDGELLGTVLTIHHQRLGQQILWEKSAPLKQLVLQLALHQREHFVPRLCQQMKKFTSIEDNILRNNMLILRLANEFALNTQTLDELAKLDQVLNAFDVASVPAELQPVHQFFYSDFQRLYVMHEFLAKQLDGNACKTIKVNELLRAPGVLTLVYEHGIRCETLQLVQLVEQTYRWQQQTPTLKCVRAEELEILSYYTALSVVYNVILETHDSTVREQLLLLSTQLRQLRELGTLCSVLIDIFQLVFLRWDELQQIKQREHSDEEDDDCDDEQLVGDEATPPRMVNIGQNSTPRRHGFICRAPVLYALFSYLKGFVTKKLHTHDFKCATEHEQRRFQYLVDAISEALWKFDILKKIDQSLAMVTPASGGRLDPEQLLHLIQLHSHSREKASSDDESRERIFHTSSLTRRKSRRQRRTASFSGAAGNSSTHEPTLEQREARAQQLILNKASRESQRKKSQLVESLINERSIIPKMLSTPEQLAIMALALKNFNDVNHIIETFHLENSQLNRELHFMEHQQLIKQKLAKIYAKYEALAGDCSAAINTNNTTTTVEQIKRVAAKGFELSKIISVVDNFVQAQRLQPSTEQKTLLQRHSANTQYGFMQQFNDRNLNAIIVCDLIVNLRFNREITCNLMLVIRRQQQQEQQQQPATNVPNDGNPREIGAMYLMQNLCECMRLLESAGFQPALNELLCRHSCPLRPVPLALKLQRESAFEVLYKKESSDYAHTRVMRNLAPQFQKLKSKQNYYARFCGYIQQLARLLQMRDPNLEYHNTQLLRQDPYIVIGELIYDCDITPLEIECNVTALHLNLVHVIALNICPQFAEDGVIKRTVRVVQPQKQESIHNYIFQHNQLLAQLLQAVQLNDISIESSLNLTPLRQLMQVPELETLALMYDQNTIMAALHAYKVDITTSHHRLSQLPKETQLRILLLDINGQSEPREHRKRCIDKCISELIDEDPRNIELAAHMTDLGARARLLQQKFTKISSSQLAKQLIEHTLHHRDSELAIPHALRCQLEHSLSDIRIYADVSALLQFESWPQAYDFGRQTPNVIFEQLMQGRHYELCYKWCRMVQLTDLAGQQRVCLLTLLDTLLDISDDNDDLDENLLHIMELFPATVLVNFLDTHKDKMRSLALLNWSITYLHQHSRDNRPYCNYQLSLDLISQLPVVERAHFWTLLRYPLLIVEQLLMNTRFEMLKKLLEPARQKLQQRMPLEPCAYCFEKRGHAYDVHSTGSSNAKVQFKLGHSTSEAFILLNFNSYQQDHVIGNNCIDLLLRIYASKALDYHVANVSGHNGVVGESSLPGTDVQNSLDSLCGAFQIPQKAPSRDQWIPDEEASHCMCCRRSAFTMLVRRHHCRRCGRVVCYACSTQRMIIPELYGDVEVRVCNDCSIPLPAIEQEIYVNETQQAAMMPARISNKWSSATYKWRLSGIITHDKLLREEFCYDHAPSVALSLSILQHHLDQRQCVDLLLFHCRKLEKLIMPNPEVDYELVAKMMNCLALAAKVRGAPGEFETIREHSEIIMAVVQQGCESLIPPGPLNNHSVRQLADSLVEAEHWQLALEVHLKWGFATTGVMAAHGLACLRAGCYDAAREKFSHCMVRLSTEELNSCIYKDIFEKSSTSTASPKKRPQRGPALLQEILQLIASMPRAQHQPETLQRATLIRNSNSSLASLFTRRREPFVLPTTLHEPALNVINTLANLKHISKGNYGKPAESNRQSRAFEESLHYVLSYGSHTDILTFLMQSNELRPALRYWLNQQLDTELFIQHIFMVSLVSGSLPALIEELQQFDTNGQSNVLRITLLQTCRYLEQQQQLNSLYQLQLLLKDPVRASMTCVMFYTLNCDNFQKLHANAQHLVAAHMHLQGELDMSQWKHLQREQLERVSSTESNRRGSTTSCQSGIAMRLDARVLNGHINTIRRQTEMVKFLAQCEREQPQINGTLCTLYVLKRIRPESPRATLPTLFDGNADKIQLCILILMCGKNIDEGFGLAYGIMQDYKLEAMKVFGATSKYLAKNQRLGEMQRLLDCISTNNGDISPSDTDELLSIAVNAAVHCHEPETKQTLDKLVKLIGSVEMRISSYIFIGQLKSAYLLANKHERLAAIRKILRQAEMTNQIHIKKLCEKKLNINPGSMPPNLL